MLAVEPLASESKSQSISPITFESKDVETKLSFTYSVDVVSTILTILDAGHKSEPGFSAYNLAMHEQLMLPEFLNLVRAIIITKT